MFSGEPILPQMSTAGKREPIAGTSTQANRVYQVLFIFHADGSGNALGAYLDNITFKEAAK